ncbi:MAG: ATP-grasp protein [Actinomycetia bacterium]|nr:ATP-grasp protein [Actinomycetes bacterium]
MTMKRFVFVCSLSAWLLAASHGTWPIAFIVVGVFLATCPGFALVGSLDLDEPMMSAVLLIASSFALDALVAESLLYMHVFTAARVVGVLAAIGIIGALRPRFASAPARVDTTRAAPVRVTRAGVTHAQAALDPSVPVLLLRVGRYPVYHGTVGAIRSLGRAGVPVHAIVEDRFTPAAVSRYLTSKIVWPTTGAEPEEQLLEQLADIGKQLGGGVLAIPSDDEAAVLLAEHGDVLREWFLYPDIASDLPRRLASKRGLFNACRAHGIPTPNAMFPSSRKDIRAFAKRATFPLVLKNVDPFTRLQHRAVPGTTVVHSYEELLAVGKTIDDPSTVMMQEYIPRDDAEDWIFHTYCDAASQSLAPFTGVKLRSWPPHAGVTTYARVLRNDHLEAMASRLCHDIGYRGVADLDWRFDRRDGQYKLVDFNPRVGAQFKLFETEAGIDVLRAMHLDLTGRAVPNAAPVYGRGIKVENLDAPAKVAYRRGNATAPAGADAGPRPERAWFASDDLAPFFMMIVRFLRPAIGKLATAVRPRRRKRQARAATPRATRGAANSVPQTKRSKGPKVAAADKPAKKSPGTDDSNDASSAGKPSTRETRARKSRSKNSMASTSTR